MSKKQKVILAVSAFVVVISVLVMLLAIFNSNTVSYGNFIPPGFDVNAAQGEPDVPDESGYSLMNITDDYQIYICGKPKIEENKVYVYFTSDSNNSVWAKLQIKDKNDNLLGETGLIKPGEYIESVKLTKVLDKESTVKFKVIGYEPDTFYSAGSAEMKTTITNKN